MSDDRRNVRGLSKTLVFGVMALLALLAVACAPATEPEAAPQPAAPGPAPEAPAPAEVAAPAPEATAVPSYGEVSTTGKYVEKAGLRIFIPEGYEFGGPIIPPDPRPPRYGGGAIEAMSGDPPSLDPYHTTSYLADKTRAILYDRLVHYEVSPGTDIYKTPIIPGLAESWEVSGDFLKYTFHLRKGVKFHNLPPVNGREMDAEDVKASLELYMNGGSINKAFYISVDRVEVVDRYTVTLHMKEVEPQMLLTLSEPTRAVILPRELTDPASHARRTGGIGTGPFMVEKEYQFKVGITLTRNPDYWMKDEQGIRLPYLDKFQNVVIPDASARLTAFRTGKIDWGASVVGGVEGMRRLLTTNPTILVQEYASTIPSCLCFRLDKEPWSDVRVRRAMSLALDYEAISRTLYGVPPLIMSTLIHGIWHGSDDRLTTVTEVCGCPWYTYDPQRAKALLAEAGFPNGFSTTLAFFAYSQSSIEEAEFMAAYWKAIGVDVKLLSQDYTVFRANIDIGGWENLGRSFTCCPNPSSIYGVMWAVVPGGPRNAQMGHINDPELTAMAKEILASYRDGARQRELTRQARARYLDQVLQIPVVRGVSYLLFSPRLRSFQPHTNDQINTDYRQQLHAWIDDDWSFSK